MPRLKEPAQKVRGYPNTEVPIMEARKRLRATDNKVWSKIKTQLRYYHPDGSERTSLTSWEIDDYLEKQTY